MKEITIIGALDLYARHELGLLAALKYYGYRVNAFALNPFINEIKENNVQIEFDKGISQVKIIEVPLNYGAGTLVNELKHRLMNNSETVILTSGIPWKPALGIYISIRASTDIPIITRFWSIRTLKLIDNILHGSYRDMALFMPSLLINYAKHLLSDAVIYEDNYLYELGKYIAPHLLRIKAYPTLGIPKDSISNADEAAYDVINNVINEYGGYVLTSAALIKAFDVEKYEAVPHALLFYGIAKKNPEIPIIVFGSLEDEFKKAFPELAYRIPKNLIFIGRGFSNEFVKYLYRNASAVIIYISNRSVSNRFLETMYFGKPVVFNNIALKLYPEISKFTNLNLTLANNLNEYSDKIKNIFNNDELRKEISKHIRNTYEILFSSEKNVRAIKALIEIL